MMLMLYTGILYYASFPNFELNDQNDIAALCEGFATWAFQPMPIPFQRVYIIIIRYLHRNMKCTAERMIKR